MNILTDADKAELEKLNKKKKAIEIVAKATDEKIQAIIAKQYQGRNIILCKMIGTTSGPGPASLALPDDSNRIFSNNRLEQLRQRQLQTCRYAYIDKFKQERSRYFHKDNKEQKILFSLNENIIEYHIKDGIDKLTAYAIAELISKKLGWTAVELFGSKTYLTAMATTLKKFKVEFSIPAPQDADTAGKVDTKADTNKPTLFSGIDKLKR